MEQKFSKIQRKRQFHTHSYKLLMSLLVGDSQQISKNTEDMNHIIIQCDLVDIKRTLYLLL